MNDFMDNDFMDNGKDADSDQLIGSDESDKLTQMFNVLGKIGLSAFTLGVDEEAGKVTITMVIDTDVKGLMK